MSLMDLIILIIAVAVLCWVLTRAGLTPPVSWIIYGVLAIICIVIILKILGVGLGLGHL